MQAHEGDWLIVHSPTDHGPGRKGEILATHAGGAPPFTVRWLDDDHESVVFPGPDARVIAADEQIELDRTQSDRISRVQSEIVHEGR